MPPYFVPSANTATNVAVSLGVGGTTIYGSANVQSVCSGGGPFQEGFVGAISGTVNEDGTFSAGFSSIQSPAQTLTIQGTVPTSAGVGWAGKVSFSTVAGPASCASSFSNTFTAVPVASVAGTFSGSGELTYAYATSGLAPAPGTPYSMGVSLTQGGVGAVSPITGTIQLSGFSCFTSGTINKEPGSDIESNLLNLNFTMNDGASVLLVASVNNTAGTQLAVSRIIVGGDSCAGDYDVATDPSLSTNPLLLNQ